MVEGPEGRQVVSLNSAEADSNRVRREILAQVNDAVIAIDHERRLTFLNAAAEVQYGVVSAEVLGCKLDAVFEARLRPQDQDAAMTSLRERGSWRGELIHVTHDGRELHVESSVTSLLHSDATQQRIIAVVRDVKDRKAAEAALQQNVALFPG